MVYVFLADGFEEVEAVAPIDILRRAGVEVVTVKVGGNNIIDVIVNNIVSGSHDIKIIADINDLEIVILNMIMVKRALDNLEMIVLPGGAAGVENLYNSESVKKVIDYCVANKIPIAAICAAPSILARLGYLKNIRATAYPTFRRYLIDGGAVLDETNKVITDGIFTTAAAAGVSIEFGLELVRVLKGEGAAEKIGEQILFY